MAWLKHHQRKQPGSSTNASSPAHQSDSTLLIFGVDSNDPESLDYAGVQYAQAGQSEQAGQAFLASARLGYPRGAYNYGVWCEQAGRIDDAEQWYRFAAERGHEGAGKAIGQLIYNAGLSALRRGSRAEARERLTSAASEGHALSANALAELLDGDGDEDSALEWYRVAAEAGVPVAAFNLAATYAARGNLTETERWYRLAAGWGHSLSQCNLGSLLMARGDVGDARVWFELASTGGDELATQALAELDRREGRPPP